MSEAGGDGRSNQRKRTRKALLEAAARLAALGKAPTLEDVAEEALVSRATAYRYFPNAEALIVEASLDIAFPDANALFARASDDPAERLEIAERAVFAMICAHEPALRIMLAHSLQMPDGPESGVLRQNRRTPLIEAALAPARGRLGEAAFHRLAKALALVMGSEAMIVCADVLRIPKAEALELHLWAVRALLEVALAEGDPRGARHADW